MILTAPLLLAAPGKPHSVIHVISVQWKSDATPAQIEKAIHGVESMSYPGLKNVWTRPIKMQLPDGYKTIFVMEFESEKALQDYADSPRRRPGTKSTCRSAKRAAPATSPTESLVGY